MKKQFILLLAALFTCGVTSCVDGVTMQPDDTLPARTEIITARVSEADTKVSIGESSFNWTADIDKVAFHTTEGKYFISGAASGFANTERFELSYTGKRDAFAIYPSSIVSEKDDSYGQSGTPLKLFLPAQYKLEEVSGQKTPCPMIADNTGTSWTFRQLCGLLRLTIENIPSKTAYLKVDFGGHQVCGKFVIPSPVAAGTSVIATSPGDGNDVIKITGLDGLGEATSVTVNLPFPAGEYGDILVSACNSSNVPIKVQVQALGKAGAPGYTAQRAHGKKVTASLSAGAFLVSAGSSQYVTFSPGNLQWSGSGGWRFAANQYDVIGNAANNTDPTASNDGYMDLFTYGSSGLNTVVPNSSTSFHTGGNLDGKNDWGANAIADYDPGTWRTPTGSLNGEWHYLFNIRDTDPDEKKFGQATVAGVPGVIILPEIALDNITDDWEDSRTKNSYTAEQWKALEKNGAVFLPVAGYRDDTQIKDAGTGCYWSGTYSGSDQSFYLAFSQSAAPRGDQVKTASYGCLVRLVRTFK